jgi:hypothetical protein
MEAAMMITQRRKLTEPLGSVTASFGLVLLAVSIVAILATVVGRGSIAGIGQTPVCVTQPNTSYSSPSWVNHLGIAVRPGATISINGVLQACAVHPSLGQRSLYILMNVPELMVWAALLFLLWQLIRVARRIGPFTVAVAVAMRRLGWLIIIGSAAAGAVQGIALDQLLNSMLVAQNDFGDAFSQLVHGLLPVPLLAGAALLTFARIIRVGAAMDDEIKATV